MYNSTRWILKMYERGHPDGLTRKCARERFQALCPQMPEEKLFVLMDLAGDVACWEGHSRTCTSDHVNRALQYMETGCVFEAKAILEGRRKKWSRSWHRRQRRRLGVGKSRGRRRKLIRIDVRNQKALPPPVAEPMSTHAMHDATHAIHQLTETLGSLSLTRPPWSRHHAPSGGRQHHSM